MGHGARLSRWTQGALSLGVAAMLLAAAAPSPAEIPVVELDGVVHAVSADHVVRAIENADARGAPLLVLRLDTPGGLDTAIELKLIDLVAKGVPELLATLDGRMVTRFDGSVVKLSLAGHATTPIRMDWRQMVLSTIARPEVLFLLLLGALAGLAAEIKSPGLLFPGTLGLACLILFLFASQIIPVNWAGVLLVVLAVALFVAEAIVTSYGLLALGGIVSLALGAMMLVDAELPEMRVPLGAVLPTAAALATLMLVLVRMVVRAQRLRPTTGRDGMIGLGGVAETDITLRGWVRVAGERWAARSETPVKAGDDVTVVSGQGLEIEVRREERS